MSRSLVAISIGPVQPFIAAARKTRDFWCGSSLLSEIAREIAKSLATDDAANLIFPAPHSRDELEERDYAVANKILAIVDGDPTRKAEEAIGAAQAYLRSKSGAVFTKHQAQIDRALAERQLDSLLELYWAAAPLEGENVTYALARKVADSLLAARKNTRDFSQNTLTESQGERPKCAIDGQRESVLRDAKAAEPLCGICFFKRHVDSSSWARSTTTHFAAKPTVSRWDREHRDAFDDFKRALMGLDVADQEEFDASYLFDERLAACFAAESLKDVRDALRKLKRTTGLQPSPYFALLRADGDRMGAAIDACTKKGQHQELSRNLVAFTKEARPIVERLGGRIVYAGGDDVLALIPAPWAIRCAKDLAVTFAELVGKPLQNRVEHPPTLSVGLVIAHHLEPLTDVLELSSKAEQEAKKTRNALAILVSKRSGAEEVVSGPWGIVDRQLTELIDYFNKDELPARLPYELRDIALRTNGLDKATRESVEAAELKRVLGRKRAGAMNDQALQTTVVETLGAIREGETFDLRYLSTLLGVARALSSMPQEDVQ